MSGVPIPNLPAAIALTGQEMVEIVQGGASLRTTVQAFAYLLGAPILEQDFNGPFTSGSTFTITAGTVHRLLLAFVDGQRYRNNNFTLNTSTNVISPTFDPTGKTQIDFLFI